MMYSNYYRELSEGSKAWTHTFCQELLDDILAYIAAPASPPDYSIEWDYPGTLPYSYLPGPTPYNHDMFVLSAWMQENITELPYFKIADYSWEPTKYAFGGGYWQDWTTENSQTGCDPTNSVLAYAYGENNNIIVSGLRPSYLTEIWSGITFEQVDSAYSTMVFSQWLLAGERKEVNLFGAYGRTWAFGQKPAYFIKTIDLATGGESGEPYIPPVQS